MELTDSPTEYTATYAKKVASIQDAFAFIMGHLDKVGNDPQVVIAPVWVCEAVDALTGDRETVRQFEVAVTGMVEVPEMVE
jgi:hypothetical protein